jgi:hypothetical protein
MVPEIALALRHATGSGAYPRFVTCANTYGSTRAGMLPAGKWWPTHV